MSNYFFVLECTCLRVPLIYTELKASLKVTNKGAKIIYLVCPKLKILKLLKICEKIAVKS